jgi:hypothetical protein
MSLSTISPMVPVASVQEALPVIFAAPRHSKQVG